VQKFKNKKSGAKRISIFHTNTHYFWVRSKNCEERLTASSCLSIRIEQRGSHWMDFHEI